MDFFRSAPKTIYSLWVQGAASAPPLVQLCFKKWQALNPDYELKVLDGNDVVRLLGGTSIPIHAIPVQALSDIVRAKLLLETGGIWVDSTVLPIVPLRDWIAEMLTPSGFFAFERAGAEPLSSWFLAASPDSPVFLRLWEEILRFWTIPRRPLASNPTDAVGSVAPDKGGLTDQYPYFWFHYLFRYLTETNDEIADIWAKRVHWSADWPHKLQFLFRDTAFPSMFEIVEAAAGAPVQKLNWRVDHYPLDFFARLGTSDVPIFLTQDRGPMPGGL